MPEIGEVARVVSHLRKHLVGKTISVVHAVEDSLVFKDTTHTEFMEKMKGKKVLGAQQWGKYFWLVMDSPPHPVMHFGMTGWVDIKNNPSSHYRQTTVELEWPPRFLKFSLAVKEDDNEFAFVDQRRLGRVRLVDVDAKDIRTTEPIASNGPDPVQEQIEESWLVSILSKKKLPVKAFLLDQAILSGIGNWVADEILFNARIHPETHTNTLSEEQMDALYKSINYVTKLAVETEADQDKLPEDWLVLHRWGKGKKNGGKHPNGHKIEFLTVGGRTSAFAPALQKKGVRDLRTAIGGGKAKPEKRSRKKAVGEELEELEELESDVPKAKTQASRRRGRNRVKKEEAEVDVEEEEKEKEAPASKKRKTKAKAEEASGKMVGSRRSARQQK
ncbi:hypothetical protein L211DRAFT_833393 [Terfezia boudieri ATCC MYA-4762]|uniref:Formamidopyrimidine-DNA glycosylase catalytic domain-containing protein n=1 Tax=Terfezia boudieri ATCC MYA-4762 TaxID=1051890 RepID=A0A3N4M5T2_9PEZI|nr:hypothetical protein L211DRAFT_833393 [Terfezia boudieri ATCC MYA-4762]